jgi:DNA polymerase-3 subunit alpha
MNPSFIHLRVHSAYSLLEGAIPIKSLAKWCKAEHMPAVAITDSGNLFGSLEFSLAALEHGIQPIQASLLFTKPRNHDARNAHLQKPDQLPIYAQNETGWKNLLYLVSRAHLQPADGIAPILHQADVEAHNAGLIILVGGIHSALGKMLLAGQVDAAKSELSRLQSVFGDRIYIELSRTGVAEEKQIEAMLIQLAMDYNIPLIATNDAYFIDEDMYEAHDAFLCIAAGSYVNEENRRRLTRENRLKTEDEMQVIFADIPEALASTVQLAKRCSFLLSGKAPMLPSFTAGEVSEGDLLRAEARAGLAERLEKYVFTPGMSEEERNEKAQPYRERLEFEIDTIIKMKFPGYFLIVSDFIRWSKAHDIPVGPGRGSGAGSLVAWSLSITDLDPLRYGLLFERFLNPERVSMPDFDVDFCQERREEVIRYVQEKYGIDRVAQIITFGKLQARAVLRDVGRVLQMPYGQVDKICKMVPNNPANPVTLKEAIEIEPAFKAAIREDETVEHLLDISLKLEGLNRHASTHAAGVVIGDRPLSELVPMYRDPKSDMPVVQYSMKYAETAGLVKFDFLGLKTLTVLKQTLKLLGERGNDIDLLALPEGDKLTYEMLARGETVGVFQLESSGMRDTLKKLKADCLEDIIALVSLYRPGPMDNIPTYIARKHGEEAPDHLHPLLVPVLKETFGVIIYQEQVMQIAQVLAGYGLGEADLLRRAMGKKIRSEMEAQRSIFVEKATARGVEKRQAASIFDLIAKFAEYGFNKSHAAAYALIAYQTAYLKANYTVEFIAASMTLDMHNTDKLGVFREDAAHYNIQLLPPDINKSEVLFSVESGNIRYALAAVRNVGAAAMHAVVAEREKNGPFESIFDFVTRVPLEAQNKRAIDHLIKAGAFDALHDNRAQLYNHMDVIMAYGAAHQREAESNQVSLFAASAQPMIRQPVLQPCDDWSRLDKLEFENAAIGFYLSSHPLAGYKNALEHLKALSSSQFTEKLGSAYRTVKVAGIVTGKKMKVSDKGRFAFLQLSDLDGAFEVSVFNETLLSQNRENLENGKMLLITADGKSEEAGVRLIAQGITPLDDAVVKMRAGKQMSIALVVADIAAIPPIRELLVPAGGQGATVKMALKQGGQETLIELPGKYQHSSEILDKLRSVKGIVSAEEIAA